MRIFSTQQKAILPPSMLVSMIFPKNDPAVKRLHYYDRVVPVISVSSAIIIKRTADSPWLLIPDTSRCTM